MAHQNQINFCLYVKNRFPLFFKNVSVLDIGSLDINGNNRFLFENSKYLGIDLTPGKNVDIVCRGHEFNSEEKFNVVISTECFEHDVYWKETMQNSIKLLKDGGLFLFTCAYYGRKEHMTKKSEPECDYGDYYFNLGPKELCDAINLGRTFCNFEAITARYEDFYFFGIKYN